MKISGQFKFHRKNTLFFKDTAIKALQWGPSKMRAFKSLYSKTWFQKYDLKIIFEIMF